jgi:hypothetical protein
MLGEKLGMLPMSSGGIAFAASFGERQWLVGWNAWCVVRIAKLRGQLKLLNDYVSRREESHALSSPGRI